MSISTPPKKDQQPSKPNPESVSSSPLHNRLILQTLGIMSSSLLIRYTSQFCQAISRMSLCHLHNRTSSLLRKSRWSVFFTDHLISFPIMSFNPFTTGWVAIPGEECPSVPLIPDSAATSTIPIRGQSISSASPQKGHLVHHLFQCCQILLSN